MQTDPDPQHRDLADILLLTPKGEIVPRQEVKWERNPHAEFNQDSSKLMVLVPGHHLLRANITAVDLCSPLCTDFYSQFYRLDPTLQEKTPDWSHAVTRRSRSATLPQMRAKKTEEVNDRDSPTGLISINRPTQNPQQGKNPELGNGSSSFEPAGKKGKSAKVGREEEGSNSNCPELAAFVLALRGTPVK